MWFWLSGMIDGHGEEAWGLYQRESSTSAEVDNKGSGILNSGSPYPESVLVVSCGVK